MSDMKCPFCQQELDTGRYYVHCHNPHCNTTVEMEGTEEMWEALIHTRKALDKAKNGLKELKDIIACPPDVSYETGVSMYADGVLQEITALEQKDLKNGTR